MIALQLLHTPSPFLPSLTKGGWQKRGKFQDEDLSWGPAALCDIGRFESFLSGSCARKLNLGLGKKYAELFGRSHHTCKKECVGKARLVDLTS